MSKAVDYVVLTILGVCMTLAVILLGVLLWFGYQATFNRDAWECHETGRLISGSRIIGKVIIPYTNEPEVVCKRVK